MKVRDLTKPERLLVGGILGVLLIATISVPMIAGGKVDEPQQPTPQELAPDVIVAMGSPNQEIGLDDYKTLTAYAKAYPQLRPLILNALANDGRITAAEYDAIDKAEKPLALVQGKKEWDAEAKPYRTKLLLAASGESNSTSSASASIRQKSRTPASHGAPPTPRAHS